LGRCHRGAQFGGESGGTIGHAARRDHGCGRQPRAIAIALGGGTLPGDKRFAISTNWGNFRGENAMSLSAQFRVDNYIVLNAGCSSAVRVAVLAQVNFDLAYAAVNGQWRLFGISVALGRSEPAAPSPSPPAAAEAAPAPKHTAPAKSAPAPKPAPKPSPPKE
jgi:hypothetical protein